MRYQLLANLVLIVHGLFLAFVVAGGLLALWKRWIACLHLPAVVWGALVVGMGWTCPLTTLEVSFLRQAGQQGYDGSFIEHYLLALIYPEGITREIQIALTALLVIGNAAVYALWIRQGRRAAATGSGR